MSYNSIHKESVRKEWIDYNGHMNVAYYVLVFDHATDLFLEKLGIDEGYREIHHKSIFVVESHVVYANEVSENEPLIVKTYCVGADQKRVHLFHEMYSETTSELCATNELMLLHVDMNLRKAVEFDAEMMGRVTKETDQCVLDNLTQKLNKNIKSLSK